MGKDLFDNLLKVIGVKSTINQSTIVSLEVDFELPRGFVGKIFLIEFEWIEFGEDAEGNGAVEQDLSVAIALIRDPDDITSVGMPENSVQHDVIADFNPWIVQNPTGSLTSNSEMLKQIPIPEKIDLITARNMRFNIVGQGPDSALLTESKVKCNIYYTLEVVKDADILDLLDIL